MVFQITEQDATNYIRQTQEFVEGLKNLHCRASISRFGLCDQPFENLKLIPVDFVKLDGSHIERLKKNPELKEEITGMIRELQSAAGLGVAYHAKPFVKKTARHAISNFGLDSILYLMGFSDRDIEQALGSDLTI